MCVVGEEVCGRAITGQISDIMLYDNTMKQNGNNNSQSSPSVASLDEEQGDKKDLNI